MKSLLISMLLLCALGVQAQRPYVVRTCADWAQIPHDTTLVNVRQAMFHNAFVLKRASGKTKVPMDSVLGWQSRWGTAYRLWNGRPYEVKVEDSLCLYSIRSGKSTHYYFSEGMCGAVFALDTRHLRQAFAQSHPAFLTRLGKEMRWYEAYTAWDRHAKTYKICQRFRADLP